jgi:hypothetical protein
MQMLSITPTLTFSLAKVYHLRQTHYQLQTEVCYYCCCCRRNLKMVEMNNPKRTVTVITSCGLTLTDMPSLIYLEIKVQRTLI